MEAWIAAAVVVAVVLVTVALVTRAFRPAGVRADLGPAVRVTLRRAIVTLEAVAGDPDSPAVRRLVHEAAIRTFGSMPDVDEVEVRSREGRVLGRVSRSVPLPRPVSLPETLSEPHAHRLHGPDLAGHILLGEDEPLRPPGRQGRPEVPPEPAAEPPRPLAERFDLPPAVRDRLGDPDDAVDLVRAILEAGGATPRVDGDRLQVGDTAVVVLRPPGHTVRPEALNHAFLRIQQSGASRGLVVALGYLDVSEVRRREMLAPQVLHVGPEGVQRMADAVALGADPLRFAVAPALAARAERVTVEASGPGP